MHTTVTSTLRFHHNGDYSGNVLIVVDKDKVEPADNNKVFVEVPIDDLKEFLLTIITDRLVSKIEDMTTEDWFKVIND